MLCAFPPALSQRRQSGYQWHALDIIMFRTGATESWTQGPGRAALCPRPSQFSPAGSRQLLRGLHSSRQGQASAALTSQSSLCCLPRADTVRPRLCRCPSSRTPWPATSGAFRAFEAQARRPRRCTCCPRRPRSRKLAAARASSSRATPAPSQRCAPRPGHACAGREPAMAAACKPPQTEAADMAACTS